VLLCNDSLMFVPRAEGGSPLAKKAEGKPAEEKRTTTEAGEQTDARRHNDREYKLRKMKRIIPLRSHLWRAVQK